MRSFLLVTLIGIVGLAGCGGGSGGGSNTGGFHTTSVVVTPFVGQSLSQGVSITVTADVTPNSGQGVKWTLTGPGELFLPTSSSVTYIAPGGISSYTYAVVTATSADNPSISSYVPFTIVPPISVSFPNVQPVNVDGGPVPGRVFPNAAFTSVTICTPGTLNCKTIDGIQVDTGSSGLRVLDSALPPLPGVTDNAGKSINECVQFVDQSYIWGSVNAADVRIAGEVARSIPIHVIASSTASSSVPSDCASNNAGTNRGSQMALGANGVLGVGLEPQDCGIVCDPPSRGVPPGPAYYACSGSSCTPTFVPLLNQVAHPGIFFQKDNNGVILQLPGLANPGAPLSGSLVFGIATQTNNVLGNATVFTVDETDNFTTNLASTGQSLTASFIDSGANGFFFPDSDLGSCPSSGVFFCPPSSTSLSAVNIGTNNAQSTINFSVDNADSLFTNNPSGSTFNTLAGPNGAGSCSNNSGACTFNWGLPFFYGRSVFVAINGQPMPLAPVPPGSTGPAAPVAPPAPWWAYTTGFTK